MEAESYLKDQEGESQTWTDRWKGEGRRGGQEGREEEKRKGRDRKEECFGDLFLGRGP